MRNYSLTTYDECVATAHELIFEKIFKSSPAASLNNQTVLPSTAN